MHRIWTALAGFVLAATFMLPVVAHAAGPVLTPTTIMTEGFESAPVTGETIYSFSGTGNPSTAWWGRVPSSLTSLTLHSGSYGLWCAASRPAGGATVWTNVYPADTAGAVEWDLPVLADYYSSQMGLWYVQRTLGSADDNGLVAGWNTVPNGLYWDAYNGEGNFPITTTWAQKTFELSGVNSIRNLSRVPGVFQVKFSYSAASGKVTGQGPSIDDVSLTGWKYGPVRSLTLVPSGSTATLSWQAPLRSTTGITTEERPIKYRVYREVEGSNAWTELTTNPQAGTSYVETETRTLDNTYRYAVQTVDDAFVTTGYGESVSVPQAYVAPRYTLSYAPGANGSLVGSSTQVVTWGSSGTAVTAVPAATYHFTGWSDGVLTATRTDSNVIADKAVTANFAVDTFTLTYGVVANGSIDGSATQVVGSGGTGTAVTAVPAPGYHFTGWSDGRGVATRFETNVLANKTMNASFAINTYTITASSSTSGSVTPSGITTVNWGDSRSYAITPVAGSHVADVLVDSVSVGPVSSYTFSNIDASHTISARFESNPPNTFTLSYGAGVGGSIVGSSTQVVVQGASGTAVTATPQTGYHFVAWAEDGYPFATRTDGNVSMSLNRTATFARDTHTLTYVAGTGGSIDGSATQVVGYGLSGTAVTAAPLAGYHFTGWDDALGTATRTDSNVVANKALTASFALDTHAPVFTITVPAAPVRQATPTYATAETGVVVTATLNGVPYVIGTLAAPGAVVDVEGSYTLVVHMTGAAGSAEHSAQFTIDRTGPVTTSTVPAGIVTIEPRIFLGASDPSGVAAIYYRVDGGVETAYPAGGFILTGWKDHTITYRSVDSLDNFGPVGTAPKVQMRQPTTLSIASSTKTPTHGHTFTLSGYLSPGGKNDKLNLQYQRPGSSRWYSVTRYTVASGTRGKWTYSYKPPSKGTYHFKIWYSGSSTKYKSGSPVLVLKAR